MIRFLIGLLFIVASIPCFLQEHEIIGIILLMIGLLAWCGEAAGEVMEDLCD